MNRSRLSIKINQYLIYRSIRIFPVVLVTGASGFLATHVIQQLQQRGYRVRGSVRSTENEEKNKVLLELVPDAEHKLELVEADLTKPETWEG